MKIVITAPAGKMGKLLVREALKRNHTSVEKIQLLNAPRCVGRVHSIL